MVWHRQKLLHWSLSGGKDAWLVQHSEGYQPKCHRETDKNPKGNGLHANVLGNNTSFSLLVRILVRILRVIKFKLLFSHEIIFFVSLSPPLATPIHAYKIKFANVLSSALMLNYFFAQPFLIHLFFYQLIVTASHMIFVM